MRALLIDLDDTLIDRRAAFHKYASALIQRFGLRESAVETLSTLDRATFGQLRRFATGVIEALALPIAPEVLAEEFLVAMADNATLFPASAAQLARLRGKLRVAIVSNGGSRTQRRKLAVTGLDALVDEVFISEEVGAEKPQPLIFERALKWAGCSPSEALFVGDDPLRDIDGAGRAGCRTAWMAHGRAWPDGLLRPHHVLHDLAELEQLLP